MKTDRASELVREDLLVGLKHAFTSLQEPAILDNGLTNGARVAVQWEWQCSHTGLFQGLKPKGRSLVIRGITIVDDGEKEGEPTFSRYIDWSSVMEQLGMFANFRPTVETDAVALEALEKARKQEAERAQVAASRPPRRKKRAAPKKTVVRKKAAPAKKGTAVKRTTAAKKTTAVKKRAAAKKAPPTKKKTAAKKTTAKRKTAVKKKAAVKKRATRTARR
jgi:hypothetical protein